MVYLLKFIISISKAIQHAHKHNCIHGNISLSKVIVQKEHHSFYLTNFEPFRVIEMVKDFNSKNLVN